jgi:hypothetical protein
MLNNKKPNTKSLIGLSALLLIILAASSTLVSAASPPVPLIGTANVDGNSSEWNLSSDPLTGDFFSNMYRAWKDDGSKPITSKAYLRYDPITDTLYVLVLAQPNCFIEMGDGEATIKIGQTKVVDEFTGDDGNVPDFRWIGQGAGGDATHALGFEASFSIGPGSYEIRIHVNMYEDGESRQTSGTPNQYIPLQIPPHSVVPETPFATTLVAVVAAAAVFAVYRRSQHKKQ